MRFEIKGRVIRNNKISGISGMTVEVVAKLEEATNWRIAQVTQRTGEFFFLFKGDELEKLLQTVPTHIPHFQLAHQILTTRQSCLQRSQPIQYATRQAC